MLSLVLARGANLGARTAIQATPLHMAAFNGRLGAVKLLVLLGADVAAVDKDGHAPADDARYRLQDCPCKTDEPERQWGAVIAFLEKAAPMAADERRDFAQRSWGLDVAQTLGEAAVRGDATELARLLACYPREDDVNARDHDGAAALHAAAEAGHAAAVDLLVDSAPTLRCGPTTTTRRSTWRRDRATSPWRGSSSRAAPTCAPPTASDAPRSETRPTARTWPPSSRRRALPKGRRARSSSRSRR